MMNNLAAVDKGGERGRFLAALRGIGGRAYLTGGPVFGLVVIALFATGYALSAIAMRFSRTEHSAQCRDDASTLAKL